jgi:hypothetical protein
LGEGVEYRCVTNEPAEVIVLAVRWYLRVERAHRFVALKGADAPMLRDLLGFTPLRDRLNGLAHIDPGTVSRRRAPDRPGADP